MTPVRHAFLLPQQSALQKIKEKSGITRSRRRSGRDDPENISMKELWKKHAFPKHEPPLHLVPGSVAVRSCHPCLPSGRAGQTLQLRLLRHPGLAGRSPGDSTAPSVCGWCSRGMKRPGHLGCGCCCRRN